MNVDGSSLVRSLERIRGITPAATELGMADAGQSVSGQTKRNLSLSAHAPGTRTPAPPGGPPSLISGDLRRSVRASDVTRTGYRFHVRVGATMIYARIQQMGGDIYPHHMARSWGGEFNFAGRPGMLSWMSGGKRIYARHAHLPARPYLPGAEMSATLARDALVRRWSEALRSGNG